MLDQIKIGRFIAECRKKQGLTQIQLAERLNITDRAISKWENGKAMPDSSIMLELCANLKITVNDLLFGEETCMDNYNEKNQQLLLELTKQKEEADKRMLTLEIVIGVLSVIILLGASAVASYVPMKNYLRIIIIAVSFIITFIGVGFAIKIEQTAGYYKCRKCGHCYVPTFNSVLWAPHVNRTRKMRCPECNEKSWQKKVISKEEKV